MWVLDTMWLQAHRIVISDELLPGNRVINYYYFLASVVILIATLFDRKFADRFATDRKFALSLYLLGVGISFRLF